MKTKTVAEVTVNQGYNQEELYFYEQNKKLIEDFRNKKKKQKERPPSPDQGAYQNYSEPKKKAA